MQRTPIHDNAMPRVSRNILLVLRASSLRSLRETRAEWKLRATRPGEAECSSCFSLSSLRDRSPSRLCSFLEREFLLAILRDTSNQACRRASHRSTTAAPASTSRSQLPRLTLASPALSQTLSITMVAQMTNANFVRPLLPSPPCSS